MDYILSDSSRAQLPEPLVGGKGNTTFDVGYIDPLQIIRTCFYLYSPAEIQKYGEVPVIELPGFVSKATPCFFGLIVIEILVNLLRFGKSNYRISDALMSISLGTFQQLVNFWYKWIFLVVHSYIWTNYRLVPEGTDGIIGYIGPLLVIDCTYYWFHRLAHEWHIVWSAHSVHHSGEDYNLATALRQGALQAVFSIPLELLSAFFFSTPVVVVHSSLNLLYQFWVHTTAIGSLGVLEYVLNTPSHHRMHHRPPGNCNYAGVLIIWDRMFGTFKPEDKQVDYYGLAKQYSTFNPVWANLEHLKRMVHNIRSSQGSKGSRFIQLISLPFRRRVRHKMVFRPQALFEPLGQAPEDNVSLWDHPLAAKREKFQTEVWASDTVAQVYVVTLFLTSAFGYVVWGELVPAFTIGTPKFELYQILCAQFMIVTGLMSAGILSTSLMKGIISEGMRLLALWVWHFQFKNDQRRVLGLDMEQIGMMLMANSVLFFVLVCSAAFRAGSHVDPPSNPGKKED